MHCNLFVGIVQTKCNFFLKCIKNQFILYTRWLRKNICLATRCIRRQFQRQYSNRSTAAFKCRKSSAAHVWRSVAVQVHIVDRLNAACKTFNIEQCRYMVNNRTYRYSFHTNHGSTHVSNLAKLVGCSGMFVWANLYIQTLSSFSTNCAKIQTFSLCFVISISQIAYHKWDFAYNRLNPRATILNCKI